MEFWLCIGLLNILFQAGFQFENKNIGHYCLMEHQCEFNPSNGDKCELCRILKDYLSYEDWRQQFEGENCEPYGPIKISSYIKDK